MLQVIRRRKERRETKRSGSDYWDVGSDTMSSCVKKNRHTSHKLITREKRRRKQSVTQCICDSKKTVCTEALSWFKYKTRKRA